MYVRPQARSFKLERPISKVCDASHSAGYLRSVMLTTTMVMLVLSDQLEAEA
jgi:hypothetical protein